MVGTNNAISRLGSGYRKKHVQGVNVRRNWKPFCTLQTKVLLIALVFVSITLNVIVREMSLIVR